MRRLLLICVLGLFALPVSAQPRTNITHNTLLPTACANGDVYIVNTDAMYWCQTAGNPGTWAAIGSGGGGTPSEPGNSIQFNNDGMFGGSQDFAWYPDPEVPGMVIQNTTPIGEAGPYINVIGNDDTMHSEEPFVSVLAIESSAVVAGISVSAQGSGFANSGLGDLARSALLLAGTGTTGGLAILSYESGSPVRIGAGGPGFDHEFIRITSAGVIGIGPTPTVNTLDLGLARNGSGVLEINSGTAGEFRDVKARAIIVDGQKATMGQHCTLQIDDAGLITKTATCS